MYSQVWDDPLPNRITDYTKQSLDRRPIYPPLDSKPGGSVRASRYTPRKFFEKFLSAIKQAAPSYRFSREPEVVHWDSAFRVPGGNVTFKPTRVDAGTGDDGGGGRVGWLWTHDGTKDGSNPLGDRVQPLWPAWRWHDDGPADASSYRPSELSTWER